MTDTPAAAPAPAPTAPVPLWKNPFVVAFALGVLVLTILPTLQGKTLRAPPPIAELGTWSLIDESGQPFGSADLEGKVWIASFFFTKCPSVCPKQQASMGKILEHVDDLRDKPGVAPIALVSISVDPDNDTPAALAAYRTKLNAPADPNAWKLLTGPRAALEDLLGKRFMVAMGDKRAIGGSADLFDISHVAKFVLVDQDGAVRGYWDTDDQGRGNIINAARLLAKQGTQP